MNDPEETVRLFEATGHPRELETLIADQCAKAVREGHLLEAVRATRLLKSSRLRITVAIRVIGASHHVHHRMALVKAVEDRTLLSRKALVRFAQACADLLNAYMNKREADGWTKEDRFTAECLLEDGLAWCILAEERFATIKPFIKKSGRLWRDLERTKTVLGTMLVEWKGFTSERLLKQHLQTPRTPVDIN